MGKRHLEDLLDTPDPACLQRLEALLLAEWGHYVDGLKFAGGSLSLSPEDKLKELIHLAHQHSVCVTTPTRPKELASGTLTISVRLDRARPDPVQPQATVDCYLETCKGIGFDGVELSTGFLSLPPDDWLRLVERVRPAHLTPKPEIGIQFGAGGDTAAGALEAMGRQSNPSKVIALGKKFITAGVKRIVVESEDIAKNVKTWRADVVQKILRGLSKEKVMFEAADPAVFNRYVWEFGIDVNLFVNHSQILQLSGTFAKITTFR
ncbi:LOW QUALITY PROTEIN: cysteine sulfinate desulfinase [Colletotrichum tofieldiae]|nr:LOW QUALITY PROTEIN: cysteine sulfinate desulfinase [Colletotrichum tofieldiae]